MNNEIEHIWIDLNQELYKFIFGKVKDHHITEDILQEVFLKVQVKIEQLEDANKLTSWVYQITRNVIVDYYRKPGLQTVAIEIIDIPENENNDYGYIRLSDCVNQKITHLSKKYKEAILLTSFKNYSQKELAEHLKLSYSGTKSRVQKARGVLKENILNCPNVETDKTGNFFDYEIKDS